MPDKPKLGRSNIAVLILMTIYVTVMFAPWAYGQTLAKVGIIAWLMATLMVITPVVGLALALLEPNEKTRASADRSDPK